MDTRVLLEINKKNGVIDIYRLLFALIIMAGHSVLIGMVPPFPFAQIGIFVEFFYLITGYYTIVHFSKQTSSTSSEYILKSLQYMLKKFAVFFPYVIVSVALRCLYGIISTLRSGGDSASTRNRKRYAF